MNDRIKLAEAMGWRRMTAPPTKERSGQYIENDPVWIPPETDQEPLPNYLDLEELPDPENDANDCSALIKYLNGFGYEVHVMWPDTARDDLTYTVELYNHPKKTEKWSGDNWMQGVAELALKVIDSAEIKYWGVNL